MKTTSRSLCSSHSTCVGGDHCVTFPNCRQRTRTPQDGRPASSVLGIRRNCTAVTRSGTRAAFPVTSVQKSAENAKYVEFEFKHHGTQALLETVAASVCWYANVVSPMHLQSFTKAILVIIVIVGQVCYFTHLPFKKLMQSVLPQ